MIEESGRVGSAETGSQATPEAPTGLRPPGFDPARIPHGPYCYTSLSPMDEAGFMEVNGACPYWESREGEHAYCRFLDYETEFERELLWDQVKICGVSDGPGIV